MRDIVNEFLENVLGNIECEVHELTPHKCKRPKKEDIATWLCDSLSYNSKQNVIIKDLLSEKEALKSEMISSQQQVIKLQDQLLSSKSDQIQCLQTAVKTSVEDSVKAEFVTYSAKLQTPVQTISPETVKTLVKTVVEEEDRSRSVMIFGLSEEQDEQLCDRVSEVFEEIGESPESRPVD